MLLALDWNRRKWRRIHRDFRRNSCYRKVAHFSAEHAEEVRADLPYAHRMSVYRCLLCGRWHLGNARHAPDLLRLARCELLQILSERMGRLVKEILRA